MPRKWVRGLLWAGTGLAGVAVVNAEVARRVNPLDPAGYLGGEPHYYQWSLGRIFYTVRGRGRPVMLLHGFGVGADSRQWHRVFGALSEHFRVYAYDQLGFGLSDRPDITYQPELYVRLQRDFLRDVVGGSAAVVADGMAAAHAVLAASLYPTLFERLVLIHPSSAMGFANQPAWSGRLWHTVLRSPVVGEILVNVMASRPVLRRHLYEDQYADAEHVSEDTVEHYYTSSHQPGARHAIAACLAGFLDVDIHRAFAILRRPITVVWGRQAQITPVERAEPLVTLNPAARLFVFDDAGQDLVNEQPSDLVLLLQKVLNGELPEDVDSV